MESKRNGLSAIKDEWKELTNSFSELEVIIFLFLIIFETKGKISGSQGNQMGKMTIKILSVRDITNSDLVKYFPNTNLKTIIILNLGSVTTTSFIIFFYLYKEKVLDL